MRRSTELRRRLTVIRRPAADRSPSVADCCYFDQEYCSVRTWAPRRWTSRCSIVTIIHEVFMLSMDPEGTPLTTDPS